MAMRQRQVKIIHALDQPTMDDMMITDFNEVSNRILSLCHPPYDNSGILRAAKMQDAIHVGETVQRKTWLMRSQGDRSQETIVVHLRYLRCIPNAIHSKSSFSAFFSNPAISPCSP